MIEEKCINCESTNKIGREVSEVYDGIVFRECKDCGQRWLREGKEQYFDRVKEHMKPAK